MKFDSMWMHLALREVGERFSGGRVRKIQQLSREVFVFTLWVPPEERVIVSLAPRAARVHRVEGDYGHADHPSSFCMQLRKHLTGARLTLAYTLGLERIGRLDFASPGPRLASSHVGRDEHRAVERVGRDEHRAVERVALLIVLLPNDRDLVLLDGDDRVLGSLAGRRRRGEQWAPPEADRPDALELPGEALVGAVERDLPLAKAVPRACFGIGAVYAREMAAMAGLDPDAPLGSPASLARAWDAFWDRVRQGPPAPTLVGETAAPWDFLTLPDGERRPFPSVGALLEAAFGTGGVEASLDQERGRLATAVERARDRVLRRLASQEQDLVDARDADRWRHLGDLLTASLHRVPPRATRVEVDDYMAPGTTVAIDLDPDLSPQDNAQRYYARYKKARRGQEAIQEAIERTRQDLEYVDGLATAVQTATTRDDLRELGAEVRVDDPAAAARAPLQRRVKGPAARPHRFERDGWEILVGRNPRQNETLSMKTARSEDLWLHARQIPGAHVIVRRRGAHGDLPAEVLHEAAVLAARFSKAASDTRVPVDYTLARYVKKPPGTPAGYVTYSREKTLMVETDMAERDSVSGWAPRSANRRSPPLDWSGTI